MTNASLQIADEQPIAMTSTTAPAGFAELFERHYEVVFRAALRVTGNPAGLPETRVAEAQFQVVDYLCLGGRGGPSGRRPRCLIAQSVSVTGATETRLCF